ncbi:M36 family metallopeptidase [Fodinicola acaciae]|uniref:M36 family metallopeptidase n=1 Tax=Fodinicola acaciae TaxID=2681555 RepID=UPI001C9E9418|nr:M36 family metallopeptidase [Fodinicola acaciae]
MASISVAALVTATAPAAVDAAPAKGAGESSAASSQANTGREKYDFYDSRQVAAAAPAAQKRAAAKSAAPSAGIKSLRSQLGPQGVIDLDPLTSTPRTLAKLDGFLTAPSRKPAKDVALGYVSAHPDVFGMSAADLSALTLRRDYVDIAGTHHLSFIQTVDGVPVFGNGLQANVTKNGQIVNFNGAPVAGIHNASLPAAAVSADKARSLSASSVRSAPMKASAAAPQGAAKVTSYSNGDKVSQVVFHTANGPRRAWQTVVTTTGGTMYVHVVDAQTGAVLYRQSLTDNDSADVYDNYPGAPVGGTPRHVNLKPGWLPKNSPKLAGNVGHVYADINDDNVANPNEEIPPSSPGKFEYPLKTFNVPGSACSASYPCTWDPNVPNSWRTNVNQGATQVMYYLGKYHDHLEAAPIGFTRAAGNFEAVDDDAVQAQVFDGAATAGGSMPDAAHINNANFGTPPDGQKPTMQMYLFRLPGNPADPFIPSFGGDESDVVYHEYTHGLSHRLVVDANGLSHIGSQQSGSMGEAWSDWYAMDFLVDDKFIKDTAAPGEVRVGNYVGAGKDRIRTQPLDCPVGSTSPLCPGSPRGAGPGGYTFGDFGLISSRGAEVHADGEIWGETLWDLRTAIGSRMAESLITRAMELSPMEPSYLDMRNSILQADTVLNGGKLNQKIWQVFAHRGMGWFASVVDAGDVQTVEDFSMPPAAGTPTGTVTGTATDVDTGKPAAGVQVGFGGHNSGFPGDYQAVTDANGKYTISGVYAGTYPALIAGRGGWDLQVKRGVSVPSRTLTVNWQMRRDWAAQAGGAQITSYNGPDYSSFGCGPTGDIDQSLSTGWGSETNAANGVPSPKNIVIKLPKPVTISELSIDPSNTCGDDPTAATKDYKVETSADGQTWTAAASGAFTSADRGRLNKVTLADGSSQNVSYVRFTMVSPQVPGVFGTSCAANPAQSGCQFLDSSEVAIYGG